MALILNIETATDTCSVALAADDKVLAYMETSETRMHASLLTVFIDKIVKEAGLSLAQIDAIAVSKGPGSYTGLRIGVSTAKGLCYALEKPLIAVNTLQSMATWCKDTIEMSIVKVDKEALRYCPMLDARRMEVYTAVFNSMGFPIIETQALPLNEHSFVDLLNQNKVLFFGNGATKLFPNALTHKNALSVGGFAASARGMVRWALQQFQTGQTEDLAYFEPFYLKNFIGNVGLKEKVLK